jgi:phage head maturation protease
LFDVSIVGVGAYSNTDVALRSLEEFNNETEEVKEEEVIDLSNINLLTNELKLKSKL